MSGKGDTAGVEQEPAAGRTSRNDATGTEGSGSGRWIARSGRDAVNLMERRICGDGAVHSVAMAEGLALAGRRAARILDRSPGATDALSAPPVSAAWVDHRLRSGTRRTIGNRFELVAADAQQAVDHCLVAHHIAARSGCPVTCSLDAELAEALALVRLSDPGTTFSKRPLTASTAQSPTLALADEAFELVSAAVGRPVQAVEAHRLDDARLVLLATGAAGNRSIRLADRLRDAGAACGAIVPALIHPCPLDRLAEWVRDRDSVVIVESCSPGTGPTDWTTELREALEPGAPVRLHTIRPASDDADWSGQACEAFGVDLPPEEPTDADESFVLGVTPGGRWSDEFLLDSVTRLAEVAPLRLARPQTSARGLAALSVGLGLAQTPGTAEIDQLLVSHGTALDLDTVGAVRPGGVLLLFGHGTPDDVWSSFSPAVKREILERRLRLRWIDLSVMEAHELDEPDALRTLLQGAVLGGGELARLLGVDSERVTVSGRDPNRIRLLDEGARAVRDLDPSLLEEAIGLHEQDFRRAEIMQHMPSVPGDERDSSWGDRLRGFYMTGRGAHSAMEPLPALPLSPLAASRLREGDPGWRTYPLIVPDADASGDPSPHTTMLVRVRDTLDDLGRQGESTTMLSGHPGRFAAAAGAVLRENAKPLPMEDLIRRTCERVSGEFDLSPAGTERLNDEIGLLERALPRPGLAVGLGPDTLATLYSTAVRRERAPRRKAFRAEIESLAQRLEDLLLLDDSQGPEGTAPDKLSASFGGPAERLIDPAVLSSQLTGRRGSKPLGAARRARIEDNLAVLRDYLDRAAAEPETLVVHSGAIPPEWESPAVKLVEHPDGLEAALGLVAGLAQGRVALFRAVRIARLEARGAYDETRHGPVLARLSWEALTNDEYLLLPPVLVLESGKRLRGRGIHSLSKLLRSGLPVHVLVTDPVLKLDLDAGWEETAGYHPGLGYVAVAHREAFVLQSTLAEPGQLLSGLTRMAATLRPAVALVAVPTWGGPVPTWQQLVAARDGRATPCFHYDPDAGSNWADRFDLSGNPEVERTWPDAESTHLAADKSTETWTLPFTFAHAAALDPDYRAHFRVIPPQAWSDDQLEIERYLKAEETPRALPFLWVLRDDGEMARAVTTRDMAFACRDRMRAWHILQELAGTNNEYARRAAEAARAATLDEARKSRDELEAAHADELARVRGEAAGEAMERLVGVLMDVESLPAVERAPAAPPPQAPAAPDVAEEIPPAEEAADEAISFDEAFIDSALCTTCQECININPKMFKYDGNKQAFLTDAAAGTFLQLVKAAEKCPARCIHPGVPRADDDTATDDLIARAAKFN